VGISRDYSLKTRTSKQPMGEISGYEIIPSHPLKYPRSKQGLRACTTVYSQPSVKLDTLEFYLPGGERIARKG
jgi:hypothetical protein